MVRITGTVLCLSIFIRSVLKIILAVSMGWEFMIKGWLAGRKI